MKNSVKVIRAEQGIKFVDLEVGTIFSTKGSAYTFMKTRDSNSINSVALDTGWLLYTKWDLECIVNEHVTIQDTSKKEI